MKLFLLGMIFPLLNILEAQGGIARREARTIFTGEYELKMPQHSCAGVLNFAINSELKFVKRLGTSNCLNRLDDTKFIVSLESQSVSFKSTVALLRIAFADQLGDGEETTETVIRLGLKQDEGSEPEVQLLDVLESTNQWSTISASIVSLQKNLLNKTR